MENSRVLENVQEAVQYLKSKINTQLKIGIILGSGLGEFAQEIKSDISIPYTEIPHFQKTAVVGHSGNLIFGELSGKKIVAMQGRYHFYEGHSLDSVVFPIRVLKFLGVDTLIITNSAGGMKDGMKAGDFMIIEDHINLTNTNPLIGKNIPEFGPRFPDMSEAYNKILVKKLEAAMKDENVSYHNGVYGGLSGPTYETPAEVRYLKMIGCHAVGMSTVNETIVANHLGLHVAGISCISNLAAGISPHKLTHTEVTETAKLVEKKFSSVLKRFISSI